MVTAQSLVDSSTRADLVDQAQDLGLEVKDEDGKPKNKLELAEAILEAEEAEIAADEEEADAEEAEPEPEVAEVEPEPEPEPEPVKESDDVLLRFVGKNPVLQVLGHTFKKDSPFNVLSEDDAQAVLDSDHGYKFRVATPKEAKEFYS